MKSNVPYQPYLPKVSPTSVVPALRHAPNAKLSAPRLAGSWALPLWYEWYVSTIIL